MRSAGNSSDDDPHRRLTLALRGASADRVLERAREVPDLSIDDALAVTTYLVTAGDTRADRAAARLVARVLTERRLGLEDADALLSLVEQLPSPDAVSQLRRYIAG